VGLVVGSGQAGSQRHQQLYALRCMVRILRWRPGYRPDRRVRTLGRGYIAPIIVLWGLDPRTYQQRMKISKAAMNALNIKGDQFLGRKEGRKWLTALLSNGRTPPGIR
jgi:hypothetical protein